MLRSRSRLSALVILFYILLLRVLTSGLSVGSNNAVAPELTTEQIDQVARKVAIAMGDSDDKGSASKQERYASARSFSNDLFNTVSEKQLVYGELSIPVLATLLDAIGVKPDECFLDIGSGDGGLVLGAALLYPSYMKLCRGLEIVPGLVERSKRHAKRLSRECYSFDEKKVEFILGDVHEAQSNASIASILEETTLAVCFATTWSAAGKRRLLPELSTTLTHLPGNARVIMVDARLDEADGFLWEGDLKIHCPDTAPFSIASLYKRTSQDTARIPS